MIFCGQRCVAVCFQQSCEAWERVQGTLGGVTTTYISNYYEWIGDGPHTIDIEWYAMSGEEANDGSLGLWIDGELKESITGVATNNDQYVGYVRLGLTGGGVSGTFYFDGFESYRPVSLVTRTIGYSYDDLYRLTYVSSDNFYYFYTYDAVGNRVVENDSGENHYYTYDAANRLVEVDEESYTWDDNGNLLNDGVNTYSYDHANRLTAVSDQESTFSFAYNGLGDRLQQTVDSVMTNYTLDIEGGLTQVLADGTNTYFYGASRSSQQSGASAEYFLGDALGSVRQMTDTAGEITLARAYEPFGEVMNAAGSGASAYGFTGEWVDNYIELLYLRSRYYSLETGRFLTKDSWRGNYNRPISFNAWLYANADPVNNIDPYGTFSIDIDLDIPAWMAVLAAKTLYSKAGPLKFCLAHPNDGQYSTDTADDLFTDYICEYGPSNRKFSGYDHLTLQLAKTSTIHNLRWNFYNGWIDPGIHTYSFGNIEFVLATIDTWKEGDQLHIDFPQLNIPVSIMHFLGSFDYTIEKSGSGRIKYQVHNDTTLESGTRIPPILGGVDPLLGENAMSIEEIIWQNPGLANQTVTELMDDYPVISVLESKKRGQTSLLEGGGTMEQTFTWYERYDPCLMRYPWPAVLEFLVIDRTMY